MASRGNADARHPAAASELEGIVDALLFDAEILRNGVGDGLPPRGQHLPECFGCGRFARRMSQYLRVGVVDGHPLGVQQDGVTAAVGILLGHVVVYRLQRQVDAANVSLAPAVPNPAGHAPHLLVHGRLRTESSCIRAACRRNSSPAAETCNSPPRA